MDDDDKVQSYPSADSGSPKFPFRSGELPQDAWLSITKSRNSNPLYAAFHNLNASIRFQAMILLVTFAFLDWYVFGMISSLICSNPIESKNCWYGGEMKDDVVGSVRYRLL